MTQAAVRAHDDLPRLDKYEVLEEIGHGGMATVYRARDLRLEREVAVKIIHRHLRENREVATRFVAEARAAAKLKHPNIVEVYDVSNEDDRERYLVVELVSGKTLREVLVEHRDMPAEIGAAIVCELCDAIEHAHQAGIIHRDIKPENVLVSIPERTSGPASGETRTSEVRSRPDSESKVEPVRSRPTQVPSSRSPSSSKSRSSPLVLKITDFGIAKILDSQGVTSTGQVLGSPAHMAPEQIEGGDVDPRTDVFALGVVLYECLVGHLPFEGKNPAQVLRRVIEGRYERAESERPTVGGRFSSILDRALAIELSERVESPAALGALLRAELAFVGIAAPRDEIVAYFQDPEGYRAALTEKLVPLLVARGEAARKDKNPTEAALDFNRAHALRPDDLTIIKRMGQVTASSDRTKLVRRAAIVAAASIVLGVSAFFVARAFRGPVPATQTSISPELQTTPRATESAQPARPILTSTLSDLPKAASGEIVGSVSAITPSASTSASTSASASISASTSASAEPFTSSHSVASLTGSPTGPVTSVPPVGDRLVSFVVLPPSATLSIGGRVVDHASQTQHSFAFGEYSGVVTPAPDDKSCDAKATPVSFKVEPQKPNEPSVQVVTLSANFLPAQVRVLGPPGGFVTCGKIVLKPGANQVPMMRAERTVSCRFVIEGEADRTDTVKLIAGGATTLAWPARP